MESGIHGVKFRIQDLIGFPYIRWNTDVMYGILQCGRKPSKRVGHLNLFLVNEKNLEEYRLDKLKWLK